MSDRLALIGGPYAPPPCKLGDIWPCGYRDYDTVIVGWSDAPIAWPLGERHKRGHGQNRKRGIVVAGDLVRAIETEAEIAVAHWWGVNECVVRLWRRSLGVGMMTLGTTKLFVATAAALMDGRLHTEEARRPAALTTSARMIGIAPKHERAWTAEEDAVLLAKGAASATIILERSRAACNLRAFRLRNPGYDRRRSKYISEEDR